MDLGQLWAQDLMKPGHLGVWPNSHSSHLQILKTTWRPLEPTFTHRHSAASSSSSTATPTAKDAGPAPRAMYGLPSAARPPLPSHSACSASSSVPRARAASAYCCASLKQARHSAVAAAVAERAAAPLLAAALLLAGSPPGLPAGTSPGLFSPCLLIAVRCADLQVVIVARVSCIASFTWEIVAATDGLL